MTLSDLLSRAARLAPEWCYPEGKGWYHLSAVDDSVWLMPDETDDSTRARILFAFLKEFDRRGLSPMLYMNATLTGWWMEIGKTANGVHAADGPDPATAALSAFVAYLEMAQQPA